jgi:hypothetical protein
MFLFSESRLAAVRAELAEITLRPLFLRERTVRRLGGIQSRSGSFGGEKDLLPLQGFENRTVQPVA